MKRFAVTLFTSLTLIGALAGCSSRDKTVKPPQKPTDTIHVNGTAPSATNTDSHSANSSNSASANQTTNGTASSTGTTSPSDQDGSPFAAYISNAMEKVKARTKMTVLYAPTEPTFQPKAPYVGVKAYASDWIYSVTLLSTTTSVPINDPSLDKLPYFNEIGLFRGENYFDSEQAMKDLASQFTVNKVGQPYPVGTNGVMKQYINTQNQQSVIEWQEGKWTIDVLGAPSLDLTNSAEQVASFLESHTLPPTDGRIIINPDLNGYPETKIGWVVGDALYTCESPSAMNALLMAVSMQEYNH